MKRPLALVLLMLSPWACAPGVISNGYDANGVEIGSTTGGASTGPAASSGTAGYPQAAHPTALQVTNPNGVVLSAPMLQVVTFTNDVNAAQLEDFSTKLSASAYWSSVTAEYGIGGLTLAKPLRETFAWPSATTDGELLSGQKSDVESYLISQLDGTSPPWGAPSANGIYMLFMPAGITVSPDGGQTPDACKADILAWHTALKLPASGVVISYVVEPNCGLLTGLSGIDSRTFAASHEIIGAATNPHLNGYNTLDANHASWQLAAGGSDTGAACVAQQYGSGNLVAHPADMTYAVQRVWSNAQAKAGHTPCLPSAANEIFFDTVPVLNDSVSVTVSTNALIAPLKTLGVQVGAGGNAVVALDCFSDGKVAGPWSVAATEIGSSDLTLTLDKSSGNNGDILHLTIGVNNASQSLQELVRVSSTLGNITNNQFILVHN